MGAEIFFASANAVSLFMNSFGKQVALLRALEVTVASNTLQNRGLVSPKPLSCIINLYFAWAKSLRQIPAAFSPFGSEPSVSKENS
jgi:hypothetical protein